MSFRLLVQIIICDAEGARVAEWGSQASTHDNHHERRPRNSSPVPGRYLLSNSGDNLMDVTNKMVNQDVNIYGLCDKQLACTTCKVDIESHYEHLPVPSD